jgi:hypothetical protein
MLPRADKMSAWAPSLPDISLRPVASFLFYTNPSCVHKRDQHELHHHHNHSNQFVNNYEFLRARLLPAANPAIDP